MSERRSQNATGAAALEAEDHARRGTGDHERGVAAVVAAEARVVLTTGCESCTRDHSTPQKNNFLGHGDGARGERHKAH